MKPTTKTNCKYTNPAFLETSRIYTQAGLDKSGDHIIFPTEKLNVFNSLTPEILGHSNINDEVLGAQVSSRCLSIDGSSSKCQIIVICGKC